MICAFFSPPLFLLTQTYRNWIPGPQFPPEDYASFIAELDAEHRHYIPIIDAAISIETNETDSCSCMILPAP
jgi:hypothetical protein